MRSHDTVGSEHENQGVEWLHIRRGQVRSLEVFLGTERLTARERWPPELAGAH